MSFACKNEIKTDKSTIDFNTAMIYHNGEIITMEGSEVSYAEVVVENLGEILFVGNKEQAIKNYKGAASDAVAAMTMV